MVNRALVEAMHDENLLVSVWTPNTPDEIHAMIEAGVDGIASDRPDWVINAANSQ
jgi:glycerophosphoryl diester phosphodiesterase